MYLPVYVDLFFISSTDAFVFSIYQLEGIPSKARNMQMNLLMGKLYRNSRHNRAAAVCYKECLR